MRPQHRCWQCDDVPNDSMPRQLARTRLFALGVPRDITVSPDGSTIFFLRSRAGDDPVSCLWALDCETATERLLADPRSLLRDAREELSPQERSRRERAREMSAGIVGYGTDDACDLLAFALSGQLWAVRPADGSVRMVPAASPVIDPRPDPTGRRIAYVSGGALRVVAADGDQDLVVAAPEGPDVQFGLAEHVAAESMGRHRGYWWAPGGDQLLVARVDTAGVLRWHLADAADPAREPVSFAYPAAGGVNAHVSLWIADLDRLRGGIRTEVDWVTTAFEYLTHAGWDGIGPYAAVQNRSQKQVRVLGIDARTGATEVLAEQHDSAWVALVPGLPARTTAGALLTSADLEDTRRLLADGRPITPAGLQLEAVTAVEGETVVFTASDDPTQSHLWAYDPKSGLRRLSDEPGVHGGTWRAGTAVVHSRSLDRPGTRCTISREGGGEGTGSPRVRHLEIESHAEHPVLAPRVQMLCLGARALRAALFLPTWHGAGDAPLPMLLDPYGGPAARKVTSEQTWWTYTSQWFAEQGFAVLTADGRGTPGRGPAWERTIHLDIAAPVLADQVEALQEAASQNPALDPSRVGIRGWSFGGYLAVLAVLRRPDVVHAAVAGAPVIDQRLYDTHWRERYLGHPDEHPEAYDRCSLIGEAAALTRPLLLIHGLADDNVVAAHTLRLSAALLAAGRPHEVLPLPRITHMAADDAVAENLLLHELDFFQRALGLPRQPPR